MRNPEISGIENAGINSGVKAAILRDLVGYFGFGSLVNRATLRTSYVDIVPAKLHGWRRHWEARDGVEDPPVALLSIHEDANTALLGMIVIDRAENLAAVDEREAGYDRVQLDQAAIEVLSGENARHLPEDLFVYVARKGRSSDRRHGLLQSYLDAVLQGFHREFGKEGVHHFAKTTIDFDRPLHADRHAPKYPRAVTLSQQEAEFYDQAIQHLIAKTSL